MKRQPLSFPVGRDSVEPWKGFASGGTTGRFRHRSRAANLSGVEGGAFDFKRRRLEPPMPLR